MSGRTVTVRESGRIARSTGIGPHRLTADEPDPIGSGSGPTPVELLLAAEQIGRLATIAARCPVQRMRSD
ncbi:hypothetical protein [Streptomyces sp. AS58]|uniref:hypothetical protein n=1 Tax=Streptomyces sp. AS58 TaxID=1519489 RepID=UPI0006ADE584|nr:hypothetical protein [Streptomyces sp. AS58]